MSKCKARKKKNFPGACSRTKGLTQQFWQELEQYEKEKHVPYITSVERLGMERGKREGLLKALTLGLKLKFGPEGLQVMPTIQAITAVEKLEALCDTLERVTSLEEFRQLCS